ncbi:MAG: hypothetical protein JO313_15230 [Verrucomicrobia bacterium]|nr:hypothetical protein [Verrucomicrobiota bacterium]
MKYGDSHYNTIVIFSNVLVGVVAICRQICLSTESLDGDRELRDIIL